MFNASVVITEAVPQIVLPLLRLLRIAIVFAEATLVLLAQLISSASMDFAVILRVLVQQLVSVPQYQPLLQAGPLCQVIEVLPLLDQVVQDLRPGNALEEGLLLTCRITV
jgi:hypothetical protein